VRVWNAYASNNSGSYTIVGELPGEEVAREVAAELAAMIDAHTKWLASDPSYSDSGAQSPLADFCRAHGLSWSPGDGLWDDWPEHHEDNRPRVAVVRNQVVVHHEYTVSLPNVFGAYFYKKGGRVQVEENHAHHPIVTTASFWWPWSLDETAKAKAKAELPLVLAALTAADGVLVQDVHAMWPAAWRVEHDGHMLTVGVVFEALIEGVSGLNDVAKRHGVPMQVRLNEAPDELHDPLAHMRPSLPPSATPRFDVVYRGPAAPERPLVAALCAALGLYDGSVRERLADLPCTLARGVAESRAEATAGRLREAGAEVALVRFEG
jgi:hypothetical protein